MTTPAADTALHPRRDRRGIRYGPKAVPRVGGLVLFLLLALSACSVRLVSDYDPVVDETASELQQQIDRHLTRLERRAGTPQAEYARFEEFYDDYASSLRALRSRAAVQPNNEITVQQLDLVLSSLGVLQNQHRSAPLSAAAAVAMRDQFNQSWEAILRWETAKRRGDD